MFHTTFACFTFTVVTCPPLFNQLVNTSEVTTGVYVNVTCGGINIKFTTGELSVTSHCDAWGHWQPSVPACTGNSLTRLNKYNDLVHCLALGLLFEYCM